MVLLKQFLCLFWLWHPFSSAFVPTPSKNLKAQHRSQPLSAVRLDKAAAAAAAAVVGPHLPIDSDFPGLEQVHYNPDIYVIRNFLDTQACTDMMTQASRRDMAQSPTAYSGWTQDIKDLVELAARGPVAWCSLGAAWWQLHDQADAGPADLVQLSVQYFAIGMVLAGAAIVAFTKSRTDSLQELRTSTSTTLDDIKASPGAKRFVERTAKLFDNGLDNPDEASHFEAPTIIRYEAGQQLAPHFDANRSASVEDANRGGQTLATLLVYLNDVSKGGLTRFGRLVTASGEALTVQPQRGDALLFFPADATGQFDERTEHEGCPAVDEKWIARIWRHENVVPPPFGLSADNLALLDKQVKE